MGRHVDHIDAMMLALVTIWGSAFVGLRVLAEDLDPFQMTWYRYAPFPVVYGAWIAWRRRDRLRAVTGRHWALMTVLGVVAVIGYHFPLNFALHGYGGPGITAATGALIVATVPLWTILLAVALRRERLRAPVAAASLVAFAGVVLVIGWGTGPADLHLAGRAAVAVFAPVSWAVYGVLSKPLIERYGGLFVTGATMSIGTLALVPLGLRYGAAPLAALDGVQWAWLAFIAVLSTMAGYAMYNHALKHRAASDVAAYIYLNPVVATILGWIALGEQVTLWFGVGGAMVIGGLWRLQHLRLRWPPAAAAAKP